MRRRNGADVAGEVPKAPVNSDVIHVQNQNTVPAPCIFASRIMYRRPTRSSYSSSCRQGTLLYNAGSDFSQAFASVRLALRGLLLPLILGGLICLRCFIWLSFRCQRGPLLLHQYLCIVHRCLFTCYEDKKNISIV